MSEYDVAKCSCGGISAIYDWDEREWIRYEHECPWSYKPKHAKEETK